MKPTPCPDPLCLHDITNPQTCQDCPVAQIPTAHNKSRLLIIPTAQNSPTAQNPDCSKSHNEQSGWGGKRPGAGAPRGNINRLKHGRRSKLIALAIEKVAADPELRGFLILLARAAVDDEASQELSRRILEVVNKDSLQAQAAILQLRRLRDES